MSRTLSEEIQKLISRKPKLKLIVCNPEDTKPDKPDSVKKSG